MTADEKRRARRLRRRARKREKAMRGEMDKQAMRGDAAAKRWLADNPTSMFKPPKKAGAGRRRSSFYATEEWKRLRYDALAKSNGRCCLCGRGSHDGAVLRVDHIEAISVAPHRKTDPGNLQVLCNDCNWGKGNRDDTDWRYGELRVVAANGRRVTE